MQHALTASYVTSAEIVHTVWQTDLAALPHKNLRLTFYIRRNYYKSTWEQNFFHQSVTGMNELIHTLYVLQIMEGNSCGDETTLVVLHLI